MKIDKYINNLRNERQELRDKYKDLQLSTEKNVKTGTDPLFEEKVNTRKELIEKTDKLMFLKNLKKAIINNETQNKKRMEKL